MNYYVTIINVLYWQQYVFSCFDTITMQDAGLFNIMRNDNRQIICIYSTSHIYSKQFLSQNWSRNLMLITSDLGSSACTLIIMQ